MTYQEERDRFMCAAGIAGLTAHQARELMRYATTLQRLAVAECNGDWPASNGRDAAIACPVCECWYAPSTIKGGPLAQAAHNHDTDTTTAPNGDPVSGPATRKAKACPKCRTRAAVRAILADSGAIADNHRSAARWIAEFNGDPRGSVLDLYPFNTPRAAIDNGTARGRIYIPSRRI